MSYTQDQMIAMFNRLQQSLIDRVTDTGWQQLQLKSGFTSLANGCKYRKIGKQVDITIYAKCISNITASWTQIADLPYPRDAAGGDVYGTGLYPCLYVVTNGSLMISTASGSAQIAAGTGFAAALSYLTD